MTHKTDDHDDNWGGAREGAGRQPLSAKGSVTKAVRIPGEWIARLDKVREKNENDSALLRRVLDAGLQCFEQE